MWDQSFHATNVNFRERDHRTTVESTTASVGLTQTCPNYYTYFVPYV